MIRFMKKSIIIAWAFFLTTSSLNISVCAQETDIFNEDVLFEEVKDSSNYDDMLPPSEQILKNDLEHDVTDDECINIDNETNEEINDLVNNEVDNIVAEQPIIPEESQDDVGIIEDETEDGENLDVEKNEDDKSEEDETILLGDSSLMNYFLVDKPYLETPFTQTFVLSFGDGNQNISSMSLFYQKDGGEEVAVQSSQQQDKMFKFTQEFSEQNSGVYSVNKIHYVIDNQKYEINFDGLQMDIKFGVNQVYDGYEELVELDQSNNVEALPEVISLDSSNQGNTENEIANILTSTNAGSISAFATQEEPLVIALDPGHGGSDGGMTAVNGASEKIYTLKIANYLKEELEQYDDVKVVMTRTDDSYVDLKDRAKKAKSMGASVLISLHLNAYNKQVHGAEVYYPNANYRPDLSTEGKNLAQQIQNELVSLGIYDRGILIKDNDVGHEPGFDYPDGTIGDYYGIIRHSKNEGIAAIIVEHCFGDNQNDFNQFLSSEEKIKNLAIADANGIAKAYGLTKKEEQQDVKYQAYVNGLGWQEEKINGETSGTVGQKLYLEGIKISLVNQQFDGQIQYSTHIQSVGWNDWVSDGEISGTSQENKRMEAIRIRLTGTMEEKYDIYYRSHVQGFGWLGWAKNGEFSGTEGYAYRLEGLQIKLVSKGNNPPGNTSNSFYKGLISTKTHVQSLGWQEEVNEDKICGTTGKGYRLEAISISLINPNYVGGIEYSTLIQNKGWDSWTNNDEISGTVGEARRLEAIRIRLTGNVAKQYDIYYRAHVQKMGWLDWAKNGQNAGTEGYNYQLEAVQIKLVPKGGQAPGSTSNRFKQRLISYQGHVQSIGWQEEKYDGETIGTEGKQLRLEAIKLSLPSPNLKGNLQYSTLVQDKGWNSWVTDGKISGTIGEARRLEAIKIKLSGKAEKLYDIYYRTHVQKMGWLDWAKNGQNAGTEGYNYQLEAVQIKLVPKGGKAPGSTSKPFYKKVKYRGYKVSGNNVRYYDKNGNLFIGEGYTDRAYVKTDSNGNILDIETINVPFYMQSDPRWSNLYMGGYSFKSSGCVPTVMTSIINYYKKTNYTPVQIAQLLHNHGLFNSPSSGSGAGGDAWKFMCNYYGLGFQNNMSRNDIVMALKQGKLVGVSVDSSYYGHYGYTHQILLTGVGRDGKVRVHDPLWNIDGWRSLDDILAHKSRDKTDNLEGGPIFAV